MAPYVIRVKGSCYVSVPSIMEGVKHILKAIKLGEALIV